MPKMKTGEIIVTTTGTRIKPYTKGQAPGLEYATSVRNYPRKNRNPFTGFLLNVGYHQEFITHLHDTNYLNEAFPEYTITTKRNSPYRQMNQAFSLNDDIRLREAQYQMVEGILNNEDKNSWFVNLTQGLGKTLLSVYMMTYFNVKTLIMCYSKNVLNQWLNTFAKKSTLDPERVLLMESSGIMNKILLGKFPAWDYDVFMCTPGLFNSFGKIYGYQNISTLMEKMGIGFKIFDEAHKNITNILKINAFSSIKYTLYLSGDYYQSNDRKRELYYRMFHGIPILKPTEELMNTLKYTVAIVVNYNSHPTELEKLSTYTKRGVSFYEYMKYEMKKTALFDCLKFIIDGITRTNKEGYKILILVNMIEHVDTITELLEEIYNDKYVICRYHSEVPEEEKEFCLRKGTMIVSTYQSFSVGVDIESFSEGLDNSLIRYVISCSLCTMIDDNQAGGRARPLPDGSDAFYFMLSDFGFEYTSEKLKKRLKYLKETKIKDIQYVQCPED